MAVKQPIGIELVRRGVIEADDIQRVLDYQKIHSNEKVGDIIFKLGLCDQRKLVEAMSEILGERMIVLTRRDIKINVQEYISLDIAKQNKVIPFEVGNGKIKVCFIDSTNKKAIDNMRLLFLNKGLMMEKYITFTSVLTKLLGELEGKAVDSIDVTADNITLVDSIIKTGIEKRASDIHFEPMENSIRIRYRIDGELIIAANLEKEKQAQVIGRLKAISNMHQEKQESQDGRIIMYPNYNIRVSSQKNVYGEKFVLRLLKKNENIKGLFDLGFPNDDQVIKDSFEKRNSVTLIAAPTGEGKTTTLYSVLSYLNKPEINITTIEDPVEIRLPGLNQIEVDPKSTFSGSLRTVLRQDPDIILVGEIRDTETAEIAIQSGQTGHYVLSTIHTIDAIEVITRLRKMGISDYDIASTLCTAISQRLVRKVCPHCAQKRKFNEQELSVIEKIGKRYNVKFDVEGKTTYQAVGCKECNGSGYYQRIGVYEILMLNDDIKEMIVNHESTLKIKEEALKGYYKPLVVDGIRKVLDGVTTLEELNKKLVIF